MTLHRQRGIHRKLLSYMTDACLRWEQLDADRGAAPMPIHRQGDRAGKLALEQPLVLKCLGVAV